MAEREKFELPTELINFLSGKDYAGLSLYTNHGTAYVLKAPEDEINRLRGLVPVGFHHHLHTYPTAPVIRTIIEIQDQPDSSLLFETFINVADPSQRQEFASLLRQALIPLLFYNERIELRLRKVVWNHIPPGIGDLLDSADLYYRLLPAEVYDFDRAKAELMQIHPLSEYGTT